MVDLNQLYRQVIMDNYKNPKNKGLIQTNDYINEHFKNPSCGDDIYVSVKIENGIIVDLRHDGKGCSICCSSASVVTELLKGKSVDEALKIINDFYEMVKGNEVKDEEELDEALAYKSVSAFPARIKCATLSWKAIEKALRGDEVEQL